MSTTSCSAQRGSGSYFIHIEGLPKRYTWQDLKDLIRGHVAHGIWTDMAVYPNGQTGGKGYARVKRHDEAIRLYKYLTENRVENRYLTVHLWDISTDPARFARCNCTTNSQSHPPGAGIFQMAAQPGWQRFTPSSPLPPAVGYSAPPMGAPVSAPMAAPLMQHQPPFEQLTAWMASLSPDERNHAPVAPARHVYQTCEAQLAAARQPTYTSGIPANTTRGVVRPAARGILVSGVDTKARPRDVDKHFRSAGEIVHVDMPQDARTPAKPHGRHAKVLYARAEHARQAIALFDRKPFLGTRVRVRLDPATTVAVAPPARPARAAAAAAPRPRGASDAVTEPTIANGSQACTA